VGEHGADSNADSLGPVDETLAADIDATCRLTGEFTLRSGQ
jgi:hypothetical protein